MRVTRVLILTAATLTAATMSGAFGSRTENGPSAVRGSLDFERAASASADYGYVQSNGRLNKDMYELSAQAERDVLSPNDRVILNLTLRNNSSDVIYVIVSSQIQNDIEVKNGRGVKVPLSQKGARLLDNGVGGGKWVYKKIEPGREVSYQIYVHDFYDLPAGDTYTLSVQRDILMNDKKKRVKVKSNPVTIKIENV
jgi:hypothetical protein